MWKLKPREFKTGYTTASQLWSKDLKPQIKLLIPRHNNILTAFCPNPNAGRWVCTQGIHLGVQCIHLHFLQLLAFWMRHHPCMTTFQKEVQVYQALVATTHWSYLCIKNV